jgi:hypothetical protein
MNEASIILIFVLYVIVSVILGFIVYKVALALAVTSIKKLDALYGDKIRSFLRSEISPRHCADSRESRGNKYPEIIDIRGSQHINDSKHQIINRFVGVRLPRRLFYHRSLDNQFFKEIPVSQQCHNQNNCGEPKNVFCYFKNLFGRAHKANSNTGKNGRSTKRELNPF